MTTSTFDESFYYRHSNGAVDGIVAKFIGDFLYSGSDNFIRDVEQSTSNYKCTPPKSLPFTFTGIRIRDIRSHFSLDQHEYIDQMHTLPDTASFYEFRSLRHKLGWMSHTRLDALYSASVLSQVNEERFNINSIRTFNKAVQHLKDTKETTFNIYPIDMQSAHLLMFSDASFASNYDNSSQLGWVLVIRDDTGRSNILHYGTYKSRRIARSVMAS